MVDNVVTAKACHLWRMSSEGWPHFFLLSPRKICKSCKCSQEEHCLSSDLEDDRKIGRLLMDSKYATLTARVKGGDGIRIYKRNRMIMTNPIATGKDPTFDTITYEWAPPGVTQKLVRIGSSYPVKHELCHGFLKLNDEVEMATVLALLLFQVMTQRQSGPPFFSFTEWKEVFIWTLEGFPVLYRAIHCFFGTPHFWTGDDLSQFSECSFFFSARCSFPYEMIWNPQQAYGKIEEPSSLLRQGMPLDLRWMNEWIPIKRSWTPPPCKAEIPLHKTQRVAFASCSGEAGADERSQTLASKQCQSQDMPREPEIRSTLSSLGV